jgi:hypothetical protein
LKIFIFFPIPIQSICFLFRIINFHFCHHIRYVCNRKFWSVSNHDYSYCFLTNSISISSSYFNERYISSILSSIFSISKFEISFISNCFEKLSNWIQVSISLFSKPILHQLSHKLWKKKPHNLVIHLKNSLQWMSNIWYLNS